MKSAQIKRYEGSEVVEINQSTPAPNDPSAGKVLVNIRTAGVNRPIGSFETASSNK
jgi:NADPH:quinone reductase-like Zn-dependent oxidoreductase